MGIVIERPIRAYHSEKDRAAHEAWKARALARYRRIANQFLTSHFADGHEARLQTAAMMRAERTA